MLADKLKKSLLQAAIQGKLTKQLPTDDNVDDLLKSIQEEKDKLIKEKKIKKQKPLPEITKEEIPFEIPTNWRWVRLGTISQIRGGKRVPLGKNLVTYDTGHIYIRVKDMKNNTILDNDIHYIEEDIYKKISSYTISKNDIYITCAGTIGRVGTIPDKFDGANLTENADKIELYFINKKALIYILNSTLVQKQIKDSMTTSCQPKLSIKKIEQLIIPIPSLAEQQRIVHKLDLLIAKLDELKHDEEKLSILNEKFPIQLKKSLLQAAIQGKLTEQLPTDDNVDDLLKSIQEEKDKLIKEKKIKKQKPLPEIKQEEIPFEIPTNWRWVRLGEVTLLNPRNKLDDTTVVSFIPMALIEDGYNNKHTFEKRLWKNVKSNFTHIKENDIGFAKITPCFQNRKSTIFHNLINGYGAGTTELNIIRPLKNTLLHKYIFWFLKTAYFIDGGVRSFSGTAGQQRINKDYTKNILLPLPPLAEQQRIVHKLDKLLAHLN